MLLSRKEGDRLEKFSGYCWETDRSCTPEKLDELEAEILKTYDRSVLEGVLSSSTMLGLSIACAFAPCELGAWASCRLPGGSRVIWITYMGCARQI